MLNVQVLKSGFKWILLALLILVGACAATGSESVEPGAKLPGVVVMGVATKTGLKLPVDTSRMSADLAALLAGRGNFRVTSSQAVRTMIGAGPHDEMMAFYARHARFAPYQIQRLMAANLPSSKALVVRLELDQVERMAPVHEPAVNAAGLQIADSERRTYVTRRTTRLSAMLLDLGNGRVIWTRQYRVNPQTLIAVNHHVGESFGASLAAAVANTMVQGLSDERYPPPPPLTESVLALLQEVAYHAPID